jgi:hypothetical protein
MLRSAVSYSLLEGLRAGTPQRAYQHLYLYLLLLLAILIKVYGNSTAPPLKPEPWRPDGTVSYFGRWLNFGAKIQKECEIGVRAFEHPQ